MMRVPTETRERQLDWQPALPAAPQRPTWAQIDLAALANNTRRLRALAGVPLLAVIKADAYGHGACAIANTLLANGAGMLAVATLGEAAALRAAGVAAPLLLLGYTPPAQMAAVVQLGLICTLFDYDAAQALACAAAHLQQPVAVHVKVDTGMGRLGLTPEDAAPFLRMLAGTGWLRVDGLFTHFATADEPDETFAHRQLHCFTSLVQALTDGGLRPPLVHAANSAAVLRFPAARFDMVRPGIALYGVDPAPTTRLPAGFRPVLSLHSQVAQLKTVPAGTPLSYGAAFTTSRTSQIATIPIGYADGLRRSPAWRAVLIGGRRAPIVGRICMDYALVDVTDLPPLRQGAPVVLLGTQGNGQISAAEAAEWLGTVAYEVLTSIAARVPRRVIATEHTENTEF